MEKVEPIVSQEDLKYLLRDNEKLIEICHERVGGGV